MLLPIATSALVWDRRFAISFVALLVVHEKSHFVAARR